MGGNTASVRRRIFSGNLFRLMGNRGMTLVELLLALAITAIVGSVAFSVFMTTNWASRTQTEVSETQQYVRIAMDRLSRDVRMAGFGLPRETTSLTFTGGTWSAPVTITDSSTGPDSVVLLGIGYKAGVLEDGGDADCNGLNDSYICLEKENSGDKSVPDVFFPGGNFKNDRRYVSLDGIAFYELATSGHGASQKKLKIANSGTLERAYSDGVGVYIIQAVRYTIATDFGDCSSAYPCLATEDMTALRGSNRQVLAENIEDMQLACGVDADKDGRLDYGASYDKTDFINNGTASATDVAALRVSLVGRSRHPDNSRSWTSAFARPQLENRAAAGVADGYRRRSSTKVIKVRNPSQS